MQRNNFIISCDIDWIKICGSDTINAMRNAQFDDLIHEGAERVLLWNFIGCPFDIFDSFIQRVNSSKELLMETTDLG